MHLHMTITGMSETSFLVPGQQLTNHMYQSSTQTALPRGLFHHIESIIGQSVSTDYLRTSAILRLEVCFMKAETNR